MNLRNSNNSLLILIIILIYSVMYEDPLYPEGFVFPAKLLPNARLGNISDIFFYQYIFQNLKAVLPSSENKINTVIQLLYCLLGLHQLH